MKHKLKGLISLWMAIALIAAMIVPAAAEAADTVEYVAYKGTNPLTEESLIGIFNDYTDKVNTEGTVKADEWLSTYFGEYSAATDTPLKDLVGEDEGELTLPKYKTELIGWEIWELGTSCGNISVLGNYTATEEQFSTLTVAGIPDAQYFPRRINEPVWKDGRAITKQPTAADPSIKVNYPEGVTYQWYEKGEIVVPVKNIDPDDPVVSGSFVYYRPQPSANGYIVMLQSGTTAPNSDGVWKPTYYSTLLGDRYDIDFTIYVRPEWVIKVTPSAGSDAEVWDYWDTVASPNTPLLSFEKDGDSYYATANSLAHDVIIISDTSTYTATVEVLIPEYVPVDGATSARLTNGVDGKEYYCVATWPDGYSLTSESFIYEDNTGDGERRLSGFFMLMLLTRRVIYYDGEEQVEYTRVKKGETAEEYVPEAKEGMVFDGWYTDKELTEKFDFTTEIYESVNLYAKWLTEEEAAAAAAEAEKAEAEAGTAAEDEATTETEANTEA